MICIKCKSEIPDGSLYCNHCGKKQTQERRKAMKRPNGAGTVYKVSGPRRKPWAAARNKVIIGYYPTKKEALDALEKTAGMTLDVRYNMTFSMVFEEWKKEHYPSVGSKAIELYNRAYDVFEPLHKRKFRELRTSDFQTVLEPHMGKSYSTVSKYKQLVTQMSQWAMREEIISTNFSSYVRLPENVKKEKEIFSDADIAKLEADGSEAAKIVLILIYTGMRIGELFSLPLAAYHGNYCVGGEKTEAGKNRVIPIRPEGRKYFQYFAEQADGDLLLSGYVGNKSVSDYRRHDYYKLLARLGIKKMSPHATRHTYASRARRDGMPPEILQKILGHTDYTTTANIYVHADIEELVRAVEAAKKIVT